MASLRKSNSALTLCSWPTLNGIWSFYTSKETGAYATAAKALEDRFAQLEQALGDGPYFAGEEFSLVDAAFAPVFRYFDVFDAASGVDLFAAAPKVRAWRTALSERPSVRLAVGENYAALLRGFVVEQGSVLGRRLAG